MTHLFFSYAHLDAERLTPIHAQMQNILEHNLWLDKVGLERGMAWENAIKAAIDDSYGVIFAVTKTFITRNFILQKEIPWAMDKFKDKQGAQLFPILFDDVELPDLLKTPFITHTIKAFDRPLEAVLAELKQILPMPQAGTQSFVVDWPRLTNFKGRDAQLIELHGKLMGDGRVGVKTAGLHGTGGIGKTQLAVEYAHRYRYHYPGGVYWLNAGADWRKEVVAIADRMGLTPIDTSDTDRDKQMALAFQKYLAGQGKDTLLVLDNVDDPAQVTRREIAPKLTVADLCGQTRVRLLLTTRLQTLPTGFESVSVNVLKPDDARAVLLDAWVGSERNDKPDITGLDAIAQALGYLPLALGWIEAALRQLPDTTPDQLLEELKQRGLDDLIRELRTGNIDLGTPEYHDRLVGSVLDWQLGQLKSTDSPRLLALTAAFGEAAVVPLERLRLLMGLPEKGLVKPFPKAVKDLQSYSLVETLSEGTAFRLHPLTQVYAAGKLDSAVHLTETVPHLVAAYRDPDTLNAQTWARGFAAVIDDLTTAQRLLNMPNDALDQISRLLILEESHLLPLPDGVPVGYVIQQIGDRAYHEADDTLYAACAAWLSDKIHLRHHGLRYPMSKALLRTLSMHRDSVSGALELKDGRILSWAGGSIGGNDKTLRLWSPQGEMLTVLEGHTGSVNGVLELKDGHILSWANDKTLRLWSPQGEMLTVLEGHTGSVNGALELKDGHILSWANEKTLRLWSPQGEMLTVLEGHTGSVSRALELKDGRILSWAGISFGSKDKTLRLWSPQGEMLTVLEEHTSGVNGALELKDGRILSWTGGMFGRKDKTLRLWSPQGEVLTVLEGHTGSVSRALELKDGRILSWANDRTLRLWSPQGEVLTVLEGHMDNINGALELKDGHILSWANDKTLRLWSPEGEVLTVLEGHTGSVNGALELKDGRILSWAGISFGNNDKTLCLWSPEGEVLTVLEGHTNNINGALELKDGRILSWANDKTLRLWSPQGEVLTVLEGHTNNINGALELKDGRILSWANEMTLCLWSPQGEVLTVLEGHTGSINGALELKDGRILSWANEMTLCLWSPQGEMLTVLEGHTGSISGALELKNGRILSWANEMTLCLWSPQGEMLTVLKGHTNNINGALELKDGRILSWANDKTLRLWSPEGEVLTVLEGHTGSVNGALELKDGRILSWTNEKTLRLWSPEGEVLTVLEGHTDDIYGAFELKDGRILSWAGGIFGSNDKTLRLWSPEGEMLTVLEGHTGSVNGALELKDGHILSWAGGSIGGNDKTLRLWSPEGDVLTVLKGHTDNINGVLELKDGRILSWASDWKLRLWRKDGKSLAVYASDSAISCCAVTSNNVIVLGDAGGRVLFLKLLEGVNKIV